MSRPGAGRARLALAVLGCVMAAGCSGPLSASQTEAVGTMTARIDGEPGAWETLRAPREGSATANYFATGPATTISIQGHDPKADSRMRNVLSLSLTVMGEGTSPQLLGDAVLGLYPEGLAGASWQSTGTQVTFERLELGEGGGHATGRFSASICRQESALSEPDAGNCREVEGEFDTPLQAD